MATINSLHVDVQGLLTEAKRDGAMAVSRKISEAALQHALGNSRVAFTVLEAIESSGSGFIAAMMVPYRGVVDGKAKRIAAKVILRAALNSYLEEGRGWGRSHPAFADSRNALLNRDYEPMAERLRQKLERDARAVDAEPRKPIWERHPVGISISAVGLLLAAISIVVSISRH